MQCLEVSGAVRPLYGSLGVKGLMSYPKFLLSFRSSYFTNSVRNNYLRISGLPTFGTLILITVTTSGGTTTMLPTFYKNLK